MIHWLWTIAGGFGVEAAWAQPIPAEELTRGLVVAPAKVEGKPGEAGIKRYRALLIAAEDYGPDSGIKDLASPIRDVEEIGRVLKDNYRFEVEIVRNARRQDIVSRLDELVKQTGPDDAVLIYYAGHGVELPDEDRAYWLPVDATSSNTANWVGHDTVKAKVRSMRSKHVLLMVDSCFAGRFRTGRFSTRRIDPAEDFKEILKKTARPSRMVITSGANEPVLDSGKDGMSIFAYHVRDHLLHTQSRYVDPEMLYIQVRDKVIGRSRQAPTMNRLTSEFDEGGSLMMVNHESCTYETAERVSERVEAARTAWDKVASTSTDDVADWLEKYGRPEAIDYCGSAIEVVLAPELTAQAESMLREVPSRPRKETKTKPPKSERDTSPPPPAAVALVATGGAAAIGGGVMVGVTSAWWSNNEAGFTVNDGEIIAPNDEAADQFKTNRTLNRVGIGLLAAGIATAGIGGGLFVLPTETGTGWTLSFKKSW